MDLRALQRELLSAVQLIVKEELATTFGSNLSQPQQSLLVRNLLGVMEDSLNKTTTMDGVDRMHIMAATSTTILLDFFTGPEFATVPSPASALVVIPIFRSHVAARALTALDQLRQDYLFGQRGAAPAGVYLNKTRPVYDFIRVDLGIKMHGFENYTRFTNGLGVEDVSIGQNISLIYEASLGLFYTYNLLKFVA